MIVLTEITFLPIESITMNGTIYHVFLEPNDIYVKLKFNEHPVIPDLTNAMFEINQVTNNPGYDTVGLFQKCLVDYNVDSTDNTITLHLIPERTNFLKKGERYTLLFRRQDFTDSSSEELGLNAPVNYEGTSTTDFNNFYITFEIDPSGASGASTGMAPISNQSSSVKSFSTSSGAVTVSDEIVHIDLSTNPLSPNTIYVVDFTNAILKDSSDNVISNSLIPNYIFKTGSST